LNIDPQWLYQLSNPTYYDPQHAAFDEATFNFQRDRSFPLNPHSPTDIGAWQAAQCNSFCFAARLLAYELPSDGTAGTVQNPWGPREPLLHTTAWLHLDPDDPEIAASDVNKLATALHTLANKAVGLHSMELRSAIAANRLSNPDPTGQARPPSAFDIPFQSFMALPNPFTPNCAQVFSACHLSIMACPSFFEDGEWTGYFSWVGTWGRGSRSRYNTNPRDIFEGIGGETDGEDVNWWRQPNNVPMPPIERSVRFRLERTDSPHCFVMRSNCFHSFRRTHVLVMTVQRRTGLIAIDHTDVLGTRQAGALQAVLTPFGIVCPYVSGVWLWLWKKNWSTTL
jgi:hypothetical protein